VAGLSSSMVADAPKPSDGEGTTGAGTVTEANGYVAALAGVVPASRS
jgi:hypothetical protein